MDDSLWGVEVRDARRKRPSSGTTTVSDLKQRIDIRIVLEHYGTKVRNGGDLTGWQSIRCPFHGTDTKPSASVSTKQQRFRCHQCDIAGDIIDVVMQAEGLTIKEAMEWLNKTF